MTRPESDTEAADFGSSPSTDGPPRPTRDEVEAMLTAIWRDVLGIQVIGGDDDFFELGGHSLLAAEAMTEANRVLAVPLPARMIFGHPTLRQLAAAVDELQHRATGEQPVPRAPRTPLDRSHIDTGN